MAQRDAIAIEIEPRRIRAVLAMRDRGALHIKRVLVEDVPPETSFDDAAEFGRWLGGRLEGAGFPRGKATIALSRGDVGLKRINLPTTDADELPGMTRLAVQREMTFDAEHAVIDYVPVEQSETHTTVVAVAAPERVLRQTREIARAAGLDVERIGLRALGWATLLKSINGSGADCVLAVDVTSTGVEYCVVENGAIRFSRAATLDGGPDGAKQPAAADAIVTETRRTWLSYRIVEGASEVKRVVLMGDPAVIGPAARPIGSILEADASVISEHPLVTSNGASMDRVWPLAGMLLESVLDVETIDFANPRAPVDRAAVVRRRLLIAAGILLVIALGLWTFGRRSLDGLERELAAVTASTSKLTADVERYQRDTFKLAHLKRWTTAQPDWLEHLLALDGLGAARGATVLDSWTGAIDFRGVQFDKRERAWSAPFELAIVLDGEAVDRRAADALRASLVRTDWYRAASSGADTEGGRRLPYGFTYRLTTTLGAPPTGGDANADRNPAPDASANAGSAADADANAGATE